MNGFDDEFMEGTIAADGINVIQELFGFDGFADVKGFSDVSVHGRRITQNAIYCNYYLKRLTEGVVNFIYPY